MEILSKRSKLVSIKTCWECPHYYNKFNPHCNKIEQPIPWDGVSMLQIPEWCPLPDGDDQITYESLMEANRKESVDYNIIFRGEEWHITMSWIQTDGKVVWYDGTTYRNGVAYHRIFSPEDVDSRLL
jgi:hypothetical protein